MHGHSNYAVSEIFMLNLPEQQQIKYSRDMARLIVVSLLQLQEFFGWLSKNCDENPLVRKIFNSKYPPKVRACADSLDNQPKNSYSKMGSLNLVVCVV